MSLSLNRIQARAQEATPDPAATAEVQKLESAKQELAQFIEENGEWLSEDQYQTLARLGATMDATSAALQGQAGVPTVDNNGDGQINDADLVQRPDQLEPGWNGSFYNNSYDSDREMIESNPKYGNYAGTIEIESGSLTGIGFSMTSEMSALRAESHGRDIIVTIEYHDGREPESYVILDGAVRPEPITIDATNAGRDGQGVNIDLSRVLRVGDRSHMPAGLASGFYVHGSEFDDLIIGSQNDDKIVGWNGNDTLRGMGGADYLFGDDVYNQRGGFQAGGGRDDIDGGAGADKIVGGGNIDTHYTSDHGEVEFDAETEVSSHEEANIPRANSGFLDTDWEDRVEDGMLVLSNDDALENGGRISINLEGSGYTMAFAEGGEDGALVITFVGENEDGSSKTFKMKIEHFFDVRNGQGVLLEVNGSEQDDIIDFSAITSGNTGNPYQLTNQVIRISGGSGDDMIFGAESKLQQEGVTFESLQRSEGSTDADLRRFIADGMVAEGTEDEPSAFDLSDIQGGQIIVRDNQAENDIADENKELSITAPAGYTQAYTLLADENDPNSFYVVLVSPGNPAKTIVFAVSDDAGITPEQVHINGKGTDGQNGEVINPIILGLTDAQSEFITINSGEGHDVVYAQRGTNIEDRDNDDMILEGDVNSLTGRDERPEEPEVPAAGEGDNDAGAE